MAQSQRLKTKEFPYNQLSPEEEEEKGRGRSLEEGHELIGQRKAAVLHLHQGKPYILVAAALAQCDTAEWPEGAPSCLMPCVSVSRTVSMVQGVCVLCVLWLM